MAAPTTDTAVMAAPTTDVARGHGHARHHPGPP